MGLAEKAGEEEGLGSKVLGLLEGVLIKTEAELLMLGEGLEEGDPEELQLELPLREPEAARREARKRRIIASVASWELWKKHTKRIN